MKNTYKYFLILFGLTIFLFSGCEDEDAIKLPEITNGAVPYFTKIEPSDQNIDFLNKEAFSTKYSIRIGEGEGDDLVKSFMVVASYNGSTPVEVTGEISTLPSEIEVTTNNILNSFGITLDDIDKGDQIIFGVNLTMNDGRVLPAFSETGDFGYSPSLRATSRNNIYFTVNVVCAYDVNQVTGNYRALSTDWSVDGNVTITADPNDPFIVYVSGLAELDGLVEDQGPLKMVVDPNTFEVTAESQVLASDLSPWGRPWTNFTYAGTGSLNTCNGTYQMGFDISVSAGGWGVQQFTLTKL